jgi:beta-lactamase class A
MSEAALWERLQNEVAHRVRHFPGVAGVCVRDLARGSGFAIRGDEEFPTASTIKIPVLTRLLLRAERGEIDLDEKLTFTPEMGVPGSGVLTYLEGPVEMSLLNVAILMILVSDNTAANACIDIAGMEGTNALLRELGLKHTVLRRKMQDQAAVARNEENISTPVECVSLLELLHRGQPTPNVAQQCLSILKKEKSGPLFNRAIRPPTPIANKPGWMERVYCDAGIVYLARRPYAMAVMTKYALCEPTEHERFVIDTARLIHQTMVALDSTSEYGQGIPPETRDMVSREIVPL